VGEGLAKKIEELLTTEQLTYYDDLKKQVPPGLRELLSIPEIGPKTASLLGNWRKPLRNIVSGACRGWERRRKKTSCGE